jgi:hypothetical protein
MNILRLHRSETVITSYGVFRVERKSPSSVPLSNVKDFEISVCTLEL